MAGAVAGLLASAFVGIAKDKLGSAIAEQASLLWNFGEDLEDMKDHLETISAVLVDAERQSIKEELVRLLLKRLKHAAIDISDMLEDYQDMGDDQARAGMSGVLSCFPVASKKIAVANRIKGLREKLRKIRKEINNFNFEKSSGTTNEQPYNEHETTSDLLEEPVIGRDQEKQEIINLLSANNNNDELVIVAIYGLGGMGKSTFAQLVYNDAKFKQYDHRVWVYVSQHFSLTKIGLSIISQLPTQECQQNMGTQQVIKQHIDKLLHGKTVLVVLDDLWEEKITELDKLRRMLHVNGSKIYVIVTTRNEEIARKVSTSGRSYKLQILEADKCWEIIKRYSKFELKPNQEKMRQIGLDIANKCGGVALAAQAVGFMLRSIDDISGWTEISSSSIWNGSSEGNSVLPSLKLSYEKMQPQLRICFSYCAIFSKGHNIIEDDLVQQWIALNLIEQSKGKEYVNKLLGMSFLQVSKLPLTSQEHDVVRYTMHDLVHDLATFTVADELKDFDVAPRRNARANKYCLYSVLRKYDRTVKLANMPPKMRALRFSDSGEQLDIRSGAFSFAKCLRILDFSECSSILLPASIGELKQLRCLIAPRMQNHSLPRCITELTKLQYLNINGSSQILSLPESIGKLGCLKHLCLSSCEGLDQLPEGIGGLMDLQYLNMSSCCQIKELPESLMKLQNLLHLDLSLCSSLQHLGGLRGLTALQHLDMSSLWKIGCHPSHLSDVLANLTNLKYLCLRSVIIRNTEGSSSYVPDWIGGITNLEHLDLSYNDGLAYLPESIGNLKRLHTLNLRSCVIHKSLPKGISDLGLKHLVLDGCSDELIDQGSSLVHYSKTLPVFKVCSNHVNGCSNLHLLEGENVSELQIRSLENVMSLEEAKKLKLFDKHNLSDLTLAWSDVDDRVDQQLEDKDLLGELVPPRGLKKMTLRCYSSKSFPGWLVGISHHLSNLVSIALENLSTCTELPPLGQLPHLGYLMLCKLQKVKRIDGGLCGGRGAFRELSSFTMLYMVGLEEWNTTYSVENGVEEYMFPVLDHLFIFKCPRLRLKPCPPTFRDCSIFESNQVISSLEEIDKTSHPCSPSRAIKLVLGLNHDDSFDSISLFHHFPLLQELTMARLSASLPESMRQLTSLESLTLEWCDGVSALPEWLGDLSSLKSLKISACSSIKSLPRWIQKLTKLQRLEIRWNKELKEWCESEENKAKLAHIHVLFLALSAD